MNALLSQKIKIQTPLRLVLHCRDGLNKKNLIMLQSKDKQHTNALFWENLYKDQRDNTKIKPVAQKPH